MRIERSEANPISVAVLSCGPLGFHVANRLAGLEEVKSVLLVTTPYRMKSRGVFGRMRYTWRMEGPRGLACAVGRRLRRLLGGSTRNARTADPVLDRRVRHLRFQDFHDASCLKALRGAEPDLGLLAGTYILQDSVFGIPRLGTINLHSGKAPEYRGAAPAFWELYHGETEVGITIHEVVRELDAGRVLRQELFPLDPAPPGDPLEYVERYRREVLEPNGVRLLAETVREIARGEVEAFPQEPGRARTFRSPDYTAKRELRRRVARRRSNAGDD